MERGKKEGIMEERQKETAWLVIKDNYVSRTGPRISSQHPQPSVTSVLKNLTSEGSAFMRFTYMHAGKQSYT